jgi:hypothetical protein
VGVLRHVALAALVVGCLLGGTGVARAEAEREFGTGVIRFNGHGPEHWHWEYRKAQERIRKLERRLSGRPRSGSIYALRLAAVAFGVPFRELRSVAYCETGGTFSARAYNPSSGAGGLLQFLPSTWARTPFASFSRFDPVANALAAARIVSREGWRQWSCQP